MSKHPENSTPEIEAAENACWNEFSDRISLIDEATNLQERCAWTTAYSQPTNKDEIHNQKKP